MVSGDLSVSGVSFTYRAHRGTAPIPALDHASFEVPAAGSVALVGPNAAGKSTLAKVLNGILRFEQGLIRLAGAPIAPYSRPGMFVAYAFQNPDDQLFAATVEAELAFGPRNLGLPASRVERSVHTVADRLGITSLLAAHPLDLPFVLRKRVALGAALAMDRPWTVLDEPTLGQDHAFCVRLRTLLEELRKAGHGFLLISHEPEWVFEACTHVLFLQGGHVLFCGTTNEYAASPCSHLPEGLTSLVMQTTWTYPQLRGVASFAQLRRRLTRLSAKEDQRGPH